MTSATTPEERARKRAQEYVGLMWHIGVFVIINLFMWALDWVTGSGIDFAYWVTIPWAIGLGFHLVAYYIDDAGAEERAYRRFLAEEQERDLST